MNTIKVQARIRENLLSAVMQKYKTESFTTAITSAFMEVCPEIEGEPVVDTTETDYLVAKILKRQRNNSHSNPVIQAALEKTATEIRKISLELYQINKKEEKTEIDHLKGKQLEREYNRLVAARFRLRKGI